MGVAALLGSISASADINIIPKPNQVKELEGISFDITTETAIRFDKRLEKEAKLLAAEIKEATGMEPKLYGEELRIMLHSEIRLDLSDKEGKKESYTLNVGKGNISIVGTDAAGAFYGAQSLLQLIPVEGKPVIPGCEIADAPRFGWRGMHLDVGRHMFDIKDIKGFIDWLAVHKLNTLHWHLTEDQGWRIEIKKYPKLTEIGGFRASTPPYGNRGGSDGKRYGGFYTQEQIKDLVKYAQERHITIVPEIDMPGHMAAAIASYPHLGNDDIPNYKPEVKCHWGIHPYTLSPKETTFEWVDDVLGEVCELFPSQYIHIGGDEAPKGQWKKSKFAQSVIKREKLKDEHELQSYMIKRFEKMLEKRGRKLIGWDEIREGGLSPNATMMLWRGWNHAIESIKEGHDVVMAPGSHTYFDHYQNNKEAELAKGKEFECIGGYRPLRSVYTFDPVPKQFKGTPKEKHVLGCQAQLWTEYMKTWDKLEYCAFPRIAALSEAAWTEMDNREYADFYDRLQPMLKRYKKAGVNAFSPAEEKFIRAKDGAKVSTSLNPHGENEKNCAYDGNAETYFWSSGSPEKDDYLTIKLKAPLNGETVSSKTGKLDGSGDKLANGVLEASKDGKNWEKIADFADGAASGKAPAGAQYIRIRVTDKQEQWLVIQDVEIKK